MANDPPGFPAWPADAPDYTTTYKYVVPAQFPDGLFSDEGEAYADQMAMGVALAKIRKVMWWAMERVWPWLDSDGLFLSIWEDLFNLEPTGTVAERQRRIVASMRNRGTLTRGVLKAIFEWVFGTEDPDDVSIVAPTTDNIWAGCISWQDIDWPFDVTLDPKAVSGHGGAYIWAVGAAGMIKRFTTSWETVTSGTANDLTDVWAEPGNSNHAWAVGAGPTIKEWDGAAWDSLASIGPSNTINGVWGSGRYYNATAGEYQTRYMWTCGAGREISRYDRSAASWTNWIVGVAGAEYQDIHAYADDDVWACDDQHGDVVHWDGTSWTTWANLAAGDGFNGIRKMPDLKTYVVGHTGKCFWYSDEAGSWSALNTGTTDNLNALDGWKQNRLIAVGDNGICIRFHGRFDASDWEEINTGTSKTLRGVWVSRQTVDTMFVGDDGTTKNSPPNDHGFMLNQNFLHIYSTNEDLDPDYPFGRDKCQLCEPAWGTFQVGRRRTLLASDSNDASGADNSCAG